MTPDDEDRTGGDEDETIDEGLLRALLAADAALAAGGPEEAPDVSSGAAAPSRVDELVDLLVRLRRRPRAPVDGGPQAPPDPAPLRIGRFEILETLGRGGFGIVYLARCPVVDREVALKVPLPEILLIPAMRRRFLREARAAGGLDHPNIVAVHEVGEVGPLCYIASAYCKGPTLASWLKARREPTPPRVASRLVATLGDAVEHAHRRGVFHRDIKPSNVILIGLSEDAGDRRDAAATWRASDSTPSAATVGRERPEDGGPVPRLTDFGLARIIDERSDETRTGVPLGSPPYMSPEQAAGRDHGVSPAADVYGLGATLYEILTGRPPFRGESPTETLRLVIDAEPVPPRALRPGLPRDLETICLKCLEKDPARRYPTARALAEDLRRFLGHEPILAKPAPFRLRAIKWIRRRPAHAGAALSLVLLVFGLVAGLAYRDVLLRAHAEELERSSRLIRRHLKAFQLRQAQEFLDAGHIERAQDVLRAIRDGRGEASGADDLGFPWHYLMRKASRDLVVLSDHRKESIHAMALSEDCRTIATLDEDRTITIRDVGTWRTRRTLDSPTPWLGMLVLAPGGGRLAFRSESNDSTLQALHVWDLDSDGPPVMLAPPSTRTIERVQFEPSGRFLWVESRAPDGPCRLDRWDLSNLAAHPEPTRSFTSGAMGWEMTPNGPLIGLEDPDHRVVVLDGSNEQNLGRIHPAQHRDVLIALSPDRRLLAVAGRVDQSLSVWDIASGDVKIRGVKIECVARSLAFSPDGRFLIVSDLYDVFKLYDLHSDVTRTIALPADRPSTNVPWLIRPHALFAFSPDSKFLAMQFGSTPGAPAPAMVWQVDGWRKEAEYPGVVNWLDPFVFTPDARSLFLQAGASVVRWDFLARDQPAQPAGHADEAWSLAFSPDGKILASGSDDDDAPETITLWDVATGARLRGWLGGEGTISALAFDPTGRVLASADLADSPVVRLWDAADGRPLAAMTGHTKSIRTLAFRPDGRWLATSGSDKTIRIWDMAARSCRYALKGHTDTVRRLAFSPDGARLVSAANDRTLRVWDVDEGREISRTLCKDKIAAVAYAPDGRTLAVVDEQGLVTVRDATSHATLLTIEIDEPKMLCLAFSPDGRALAAAGTGGDIGLWDPATGQSLLTLEGTGAQVNALAFSPDGLTLASCSHDGAVRIWRARPR